MGPALLAVAPALAADVTPERLVNADREPQNWLMNHRTYDAHDEVVLLVPDDLEAVDRIDTIAQQEMLAAVLDVFPQAPSLGAKRESSASSPH
jgi:hypothetical protein